MPWRLRSSKKRPTRMLNDLRRWSYDNSQGVVSFWIGAAIVGVVVIVIITLLVT